MSQVSPELIESIYQKLMKEAVAGGYNLNPDAEFTKGLIEALLVNEERYGHWSCPCRLSDGDRHEDLDIICPCDYRDPDLAEFGACFCALYVSAEIARGKKNAEPIPDRRPVNREERSQNKTAETAGGGFGGNLAFPVWRCKVCGYLAAREEPPAVCPVCKATKDRFERFA